MIDFSLATRLVNSYEGAGHKLKIVYNGNVYLLKFSEELISDPKKPLQASISNSPASEYLGCYIFNLLGIKAQETLLGVYKNNNVVACKDFIDNSPDPDRYQLIEFRKLQTSFLGSSSVLGRTPAYDNVLDVFEHHPDLVGIREQAEQRYWQMFVIDALIGNFDRHAGNWGYILDRNTNRITDLAPVYDCAASLYPALSEEAMGDLIADRNLLVDRITTFPRATLRINSNTREKVLYHEFLLSPEGRNARHELLEIVPGYNNDLIDNIIDNTPGITPIRKEFYSRLLQTRFEVILSPAYKVALEERQLHNDLFHEEKLSQTQPSATVSNPLAATKVGAKERFENKVSRVRQIKDGADSAQTHLQRTSHSSH